MQETSIDALVAAVIGVDVALVASFLVLYQQGSTRYGCGVASVIWRSWWAALGFIGAALITLTALIAWGDRTIIPGATSGWFPTWLVIAQIVLTLITMVSMLRGVTHGRAIARYAAGIRTRHLLWSPEAEIAEQAIRAEANRRFRVPTRSIAMWNPAFANENSGADRSPRCIRFRRWIARLYVWMLLHIEGTALLSAPPAIALPEFACAAVRASDSGALHMMARGLNETPSRVETQTSSIESPPRFPKLSRR